MGEKVTNPAEPNDEVPGCDFCQTEGVEVKHYERNGIEGDLCAVCDGSFAGNALFYPQQYRAEYLLLQNMSIHTNMILKAINK